MIAIKLTNEETKKDRLKKSFVHLDITEGKFSLQQTRSKHFHRFSTF